MLAPKKTGIVSTVNIFILFDGENMMKLKKGASSKEALELLGEPIKVRPGKDTRNKRLYFKLKANYYELLFLDDSLELCIKTKKI